MNRKQIERFIHKVYPCHNIQVKYYKNTSDLVFAKSKSECSYLMECLSFTNWLNDYGSIYLNLNFIRGKQYTKRNGIFLKCAILHELGHFHLSHLGLKSDMELEAQLFAIRAAEKFKMCRIQKALVYWLWAWGISDDNVYKKAYDLSLDNKECKEYYRCFGYSIP